MTKENQTIPWGLPLSWPDNELKKLGLNEESYLTILGSGDVGFLTNQQQKYGAYTTGIDISSEMYQFAQQDHGEKLFAVWDDLTALPNYLTRMGESIRSDITSSKDPDFYICSSLLVNFVEPADRQKFAAALTYALKTNDILVIIDHLQKDTGPFGNENIHQEYQNRYSEAQAIGKLYGDTWTNHPPRWIHHFSVEELETLFPNSFYNYVDIRTVPYTGDSGKTTNAIQLILEMQNCFSKEEIENYYGVAL